MNAQAMTGQDRVTYWWKRATEAENKLKARIVTTADALEALPVLTVIRDAAENVHERLEWNYGPTLQWVSDGAEDRQPKLPVTVLYLPEETEA